MTTRILDNSYRRYCRHPLAYYTQGPLDICFFFALLFLLCVCMYVLSFCPVYLSLSHTHTPPHSLEWYPGMDAMTTRYEEQCTEGEKWRDPSYFFCSFGPN